MPSPANRHFRAVSLLIFAFTLAGCAFLLSLDPDPPLPAPSDPIAIIVGIAVKHKSFGSPYPVRGEVYFVKFEDGSSDDVMRGQLVRSNCRRAGYHYLLNAQPGRYTAIGVRRIPGGLYSGYTALFDRALVTRLTQTVAPGTVALLGDITVNMTWGIMRESDFDDVQQHYFKELEGERCMHGVGREAILGSSGGVVPWERNTQRGIPPGVSLPTISGHPLVTFTKGLELMDY